MKGMRIKGPMFCSQGKCITDTWKKNRQTEILWNKMDTFLENKSVSINKVGYQLMCAQKTTQYHLVICAQTNEPGNKGVLVQGGK